MNGPLGSISTFVPFHAGSQAEPHVCPCNQCIINEGGDDIHICKKNAGSQKDAHGTIVTALKPDKGRYSDVENRLFRC